MSISATNDAIRTAYFLLFGKLQELPRKKRLLQ